MLYTKVWVSRFVFSEALIICFFALGKNEAQRQLAMRDKKQKKPTKLTDRLKVQIQKLK